MNPITMMRNSLGKEEGGSGVPLDRVKYMESVDFWSKNALIKWQNNKYMTKYFNNYMYKFSSFLARHQAIIK